MMRTYRQYGKQPGREYSVRYADGRQEGVCTCAYNARMSRGEKLRMARRITAALNLTAALSVEQIEALAAEQRKPVHERTGPSPKR